MNPGNAGLVECLAQRYVIGMMRGHARRRFAAHAALHFHVRRRIDYWEERLAPLAWSLPPETPSALLWPRLCRELGFGARTRPVRTARWQSVAAAFAVLAIAAGGGWWQAARQPPQLVTERVVERVPERVAVAVVADDAGQPVWVARLAPDSGELTARAIAAPDVVPEHDYQLWLLAESGTPLSLGLLPRDGSIVRPIGDAALAALGGSRMVAVSLEPAGGSPAAGPTGPVLFTAALLAP